MLLDVCHPGGSGCVLSFSFRACSGHHISLGLLLLRLCNEYLSLPPKNSKTAQDYTCASCCGCFPFLSIPAPFLLVPLPFSQTPFSSAFASSAYLLTPLSPSRSTCPPTHIFPYSQFCRSCLRLKPKQQLPVLPTPQCPPLPSLPLLPHPHRPSW